MDGSSSEGPCERYTAGRPATSGRAVPIVIRDRNGGFRLDESALRRIFLRGNVHDKPVVVVSVAGAFRTGKSFLLNFFLRYMRKKGRADWMCDSDEPLEGFPCRGGCERDTTGILVWDEVFLVTRPKGDQVAVLLMDTQGTFDFETPFKDVAELFALSVLTSSVLVYNLRGNIREDDLQHLEYFIENGLMTEKHGSSQKIFQKLVFLVRDWCFVCSAPYGAEGGKTFLNIRLQNSMKNPEQKRLRDNMTSCFESIDCFLMPYPGKQVATGHSKAYLKDMDDTFKHHLRDFVGLLLAKDKLVAKRMNGREVSCREWVTYFSKYAEIFRREQLPEPKSLLEATAAASNQAALYKAKARYQEGMRKECGANKPFQSQRDMDRHHQAQKKAALDLFTNLPKMGGDLFSKPYMEALNKEIEEMYLMFVEYNNNKSTASARFANALRRLQIWIW